jgi:MoaA/NifB/PqqE/SkfB family radical SAM enzyme
MSVLMPSARRVLRGALNPIDEKIRRRAPVGEILSALDKARVPVRHYFERRLGDSLVAAALTLKMFNLLLAKYHFLARSTALFSRPFGLLVDPSNGCNLACPGCVQSTRAKSLKLFDWNNGLLGADRFARLLAGYGPYAMQIMFCNWGEPITNPNTPRLIEMAREYLIQTALSTNLSLARFDAEPYVRSGLDFMYLAIDGATQPVYGKYRKNGDIAVVYRNVERLVEAKRKLGSHTPVLRWQYLAFEHNAHEIHRALEIARALGVDQFVVEPPFDVGWDDPNVRPAADVRPFQLELVKHTEQMLAENCRRPMTGAAAGIVEWEFDRGWARDRAEPGGGRIEPGAAQAHTCSWLYKNMAMDANGRILPCCGAPKPGANLVFATLGDDPSDHFNSEHYLQARRYFGNRPAYEAERASGGPAPYCATCEWDQDHTEFGAEQVAQYLRTVGRGAVEPASIEMCCNW